MSWWAWTKARAFKVFQQAVRQHFGFLETLGYEGPAFSREKSSVENGWVYTAEYRRADRQVRIDVVDSPRPSFSGFISREPGRDNGDDMDLDLFAKRYDPKIAAALSDAYAIAGKSVETTIAAVLPLYAALLEGTAKPVVTGESWESGFYSDWTI